MKEIDDKFNSLWEFMENISERIHSIHNRIVLIERALGSMSKVMEDGDE